MAFSVMNRLLLLRSHDQLSPVEVALSSQPAGYQNQHIVGVIAGMLSGSELNFKPIYLSWIA
ncbi:hypothetical protein DPMN_153660 [Dreissena polymorpha]|uniref:Uncharacterized protein n=1 Tax=Dreissena polymorpha TaxID=45954 RepID=A0A9D4FJR4_DREPO|nr:hypothetical protein DPMN_153660 [Dreissena polymorpha]